MPAPHSTLQLHYAQRLPAVTLFARLPALVHQLFQLWYRTHRATSSLRLADTTGAVRALTGVLWGAASLAPIAMDVFIERAMTAICCLCFRCRLSENVLLISSDPQREDRLRRRGGDPSQEPGWTAILTDPASKLAHLD